MGIRLAPTLILVAASAASSWVASKVAPRAASGPAPSATASPVREAGAQPPAAAPSPADVAQPVPDHGGRQRLVDWLQAHLPQGGRLDDAGGSAPEVVHTVAAGDTALTIAKAYLDLTEVYRAKDLASAIASEHPDLRAGTEVRIPHLVTAPPPDPAQDRMAWPADRALKGIFLTGETAGAAWPEMLDRIQAHGLNAVVVDAKAYAGAVTYRTHVQRALQSGAGSAPPIRDYARAVRFAHERGIYVIARITCFHDPWMAAHVPRLSVRSASGGAAPIGWLDPANGEAQDYLIDLVKEVIALGADEVQLDYVRFPVQDAADAAMLRPDGHRSQAIASFVARVHEVAEAQHVPLSLDVFGIAASGPPGDVESLGQNLVLLGPVAEAISPMVYPSHYPVGMLGFEKPGDHPELVGFGTHAALARLRGGHVGGTIIRPWLQASSFRTTEFGPKYIQDEIRSAEASGATGWLMWDAGNSYWAVWKALPIVHPAAPAGHEATASR